MQWPNLVGMRQPPQGVAWQPAPILSAQTVLWSLLPVAQTEGASGKVPSAQGEFSSWTPDHGGRGNNGLYFTPDLLSVK